MALDDQIETYRSEANFEAVIITDLKGNLISAARSDETPPESLDALLNISARIVERPEDQLALAQSGESLFYDWEDRQVVCRWFNTSHGPRLLVILSDPKVAYKRTAAKIIKSVQDAG